MKKLPKTINVVGKRFKVVPVRDKTKVGENGYPYLGMCYYEKKKLHVFIGTKDEPLDAEEVWDTLLHEMLHALLGGNPGLKKMLGDNEESFVGQLAPQLLDTLMRNDLLDIA